MSQNSKRQKDLSQEELELHEVLDSISGSVTTATATPPSDNVTDNNNNNNNNINNNNVKEKSNKTMDKNEMRHMFKEFMDYYHEMKDYVDPEQEEEVDEELPDAQPIFGVNINEQSTRVEAVEGTYAPSRDYLPTFVNSAFTRDAPVDVHLPPPTVAAPIQSNVNYQTNAPMTSGNVPLASGNAPGPSSATLPLPSLRPPMNWDPDPSVLAWGVTTLDTCEWSKEDREKLIKDFSPNEDFDHIFTAVPNPPELLAAIKYKDNLERDYLFKRAETEQFLFSAAEDLSCGFHSKFVS